MTEAMIWAEYNRRARDIIIDLILFYIYIAGSFNHIALVCEALIYTECIPIIVAYEGMHLCFSLLLSDD